MTSNQVLSMYENIAGLTNKMAMAAQMSDWDGLTTLEGQCADQAAGVSAGMTLASQSGAARARKIELLKQILANDRAIRDVTEPWMNKVAGLSQ